jgi:hypothetical protein
LCSADTVDIDMKVWGRDHLMHVDIDSAGNLGQALT